jgi:hypothetical protein
MYPQEKSRVKKKNLSDVISGKVLKFYCKVKGNSKSPTLAPTTFFELKFASLLPGMCQGLLVLLFNSLFLYYVFQNLETTWYRIE